MRIGCGISPIFDAVASASCGVWASRVTSFAVVVGLPIVPSVVLRIMLWSARGAMPCVAFRASVRMSSTCAANW